MKILVGIPVRGIYDDVKPKTKVCLDMMKASSEHAVQVFMSRGQQITQNSYNIVTKALADGWDYLLYTGDDILFPPSALDRMVSHNVDIVGGVCTWKTPPYWVPAGMEVGKKLKYFTPSPEEVRIGVLKEVDFVGSGFMLINRKTLQGVEEYLRDKVYREVPEEYRWMCPVPYFPVTFDPDRNVLTGSDFAFCRLARRAGAKIFLDCGVVCGHRWEGEYNIFDHWRWTELHGMANTEPRWPGDRVNFVPMDEEKIYMGPEPEGLPVTITSSGNEYHAMEHILPILRAYFVPLDKPEGHGQTPFGYIVGFHLHDKASFNDYMAFSDKFDRVLLHWVGSDILNIPKWQDADKLETLNSDKFVHLVEDERLLPELSQYIRNPQVLPIPSVKVFPPDPLPENFSVAVYYPKHRHEFHYGDVMKEVIERMPNVNFKLFHLYGEKPDFMYPNMAWLGNLPDQEYAMQIARSSCTLRLSKHDGRPFTVVEYAMAGRRFVTNFDMKHSYRVSDVPTADEVIMALKEIGKQKEPDMEALEYYRSENDHGKFRDAVKMLLGNPYEYEAYWEKRYASGARGGGGPVPLSEEAEWVNRQITQAIGQAKCETVLDVGCGSMVRWEKLPVKPSRYTGIDVSAKAIGIAAKKFPHATFSVANVVIDEIPQADALVTIDVLPHIKPEHFKATVDKLFAAARKMVIVKTSLGVDDGYYQHAHDWDNVAPDGWVRNALPGIPGNNVAQFWVYEKKGAPVAVQV